ncbi:MAG: hypothetical protein M3N00_02315 [Actinomycetota bacterium]|nr:hypothetical protein [Actinomycetota bacterium]
MPSGVNIPEYTPITRGALPSVLTSPRTRREEAKELAPHGEYPLPEELARHAPESRFAPYRPSHEEYC